MLTAPNIHLNIIFWLHKTRHLDGRLMYLLYISKAQVQMWVRKKVLCYLHYDLKYVWRFNNAAGQIDEGHQEKTLGYWERPQCLHAEHAEQSSENPKCSQHFSCPSDPCSGKLWDVIIILCKVKFLKNCAAVSSRLTIDNISHRPDSITVDNTASWRAGELGTRPAAARTDRPAWNLNLISTKMWRQAQWRFWLLVAWSSIAHICIVLDLISFKN